MTTTTTSYLPVDFIDADDYHDAVDRLKLLNRGSGFSITIERTKHDRNALRQARRVFLRCWKSRNYKCASTGIRKSHTRSTQCPWRADLVREETGWRVVVKNSEHNHELDAATPPRKVQRRQKPQPPPRALEAMTTYPTESLPPPPGPASASAPPYPHNVSYPPQPFPMFLAHAPYPPRLPPSLAPPPQQAQPYHPGVIQFRLAAETPSTAGPTVSNPNPPSTSRRRTQPEQTATPPAAHSTSNSHRFRRKGFAVMSEIKRHIVPIDSRTVLTTRNQFRPESPCFLVYHDSFNSILGENPDLLVAYEDNFNFAHGSAIYSPERDIVYMSSKPFVPSGKYEKTVQLNKLTRDQSGAWKRDQILTLAVLINGGTNYGNGLLFTAQGDYRDLGGLVYIEADYPHKSSVLLNNYLNRRFNSVNDVVVHSGGSIWFTDPVYGFEQGQRPKPELPNQVYRFNPETGDVRVVADGLGRPKGICFSPDEDILYLTDTDSFHGDGSTDLTRAATIYAYDIMERGDSQFLVNRRVFAMPDTGVPDGISCDSAGNVYAACGDGLNVWNEIGMLIGKVLIPGGIASFCFGKPGELFLLGGERFWNFKVAQHVKGALLISAGLQPGSPERDSSVESMPSLFGGRNEGRNERLNEGQNM